MVGFSGMIIGIGHTKTGIIVTVMRVMELHRHLNKKINAKMSEDFCKVHSIKKNDFGIIGGRIAHVGEHHGW